MQATPVNIAVSSHVWVEDPALAWIDGEVTKIVANDVHVRTTTGKTVGHYFKIVFFFSFVFFIIWDKCLRV